MATLQDFRTEAEQVISFLVMETGSLLAFQPPKGHASSDYALDLTQVRAGQKVWQLRCQSGPEDPESDANVVYQTAQVEISVHRGLHTRELPTDESWYIGDEMLYNQEGLLDRAYWRDRATVDSLIDDPELSSDVERVGNVMSYTVSMTVRIAL